MNESLKPIIADKMFNLAVEACQEHINNGKKIGDAELISIIQQKSDFFENQFMEKKDTLGMDQEEIKDLIKGAVSIVVQKFAGLAQR